MALAAEVEQTLTAKFEAVLLHRWAMAGSVWWRGLPG